MARKKPKVIIRNIESKIKILEKKSEPQKIALEESVEIPEEIPEKKSSIKPLQSLEEIDQTPQLNVQEQNNSRNTEVRSTHYDQTNSRKTNEYAVEGARDKKYDSTESSQESPRQIKRSRSRGLFDREDENKRDGLRSMDEHDGHKYESNVHEARRR